jgi:hypothetical protein
MRSIGVLFIISLIVCGCATNPTVPSIDDEISQDLSVAGINSQAGNHRLWGEWTLHFSADHSRVDAVPMRSGRFHLNVPRFLEEYCTDCLDIESIKNNGDGTIDLTVRIIHPFAGHPEYTGFDVKGIIMFQASHSVPWWSRYIYPYGTDSDYSYFYMSWAEVGDPEVLNPDGYTVRWSPYWDSGSSMPIFSYWEGKYTRGTPTANINAYRNFYTDEERHMFRVDGSDTETYLISLPPGPVIAGYAVEASWEPPINTPVTDPINDFPISANQEEPYYFRFVVNNDEPITEHELKGEYMGDCSAMRYEWRQWHGREPIGVTESWPPFLPHWLIGSGSFICKCAQEPPPGMEYRSTEKTIPVYDMYGGESGNYRGVAVIWHPDWMGEPHYVAYDVFDFTLDF